MKLTRFEGLPSHGGWIRKWFIKTDVSNVELEQLPRLRVERDQRFEVGFHWPTVEELQVVAVLELDDERQMPVALRRL